MADNDAALATLDAMIERAKSLEIAPQEVAKAVAPALRAELEANIAAGRDPSGAPWKETKSGEKPLKNAAKALDVRVSGAVVIAEVSGPEALHHLGLAKGHVMRRILPRAVTQGIADAATRAFSHLLQGK